MFDEIEDTDSNTEINNEDTELQNEELMSASEGSIDESTAGESDESVAAQSNEVDLEESLDAHDVDGDTPIEGGEEQLSLVEEDGPEEGLIESEELAAYQSEEVEELEHIDNTQALSIIESVLFSTDRPQGLGVFKQVFKGTNIDTAKIKKLIDELKIDYAGGQRGVTLEEASGGYQIRTKSDNMAFIKRMIKGRTFKLSGPALEVLSIVAYKQPCIKSQVDEIRGVESGHILRGLMDRGMVSFAGKSDLPGKPMLYQTSRKFLEIFGLRNLNELPTLSEIDELLPEGIDEQVEENQTLDQITTQLSKDALETYSESEEELGKITDQLTNISTSSDFFEQEKVRLKAEKDANRAQDIEDALTVGEDVDAKDIKWLEKYKAKLEEEQVTELQEEETELSGPKGGDDIQSLSEEDALAAIVKQSGEGLDVSAEGSGEKLEQDNASQEEGNELDFALKDHDFIEDEPEVEKENSAEDEPLSVAAIDEEVEESKIGEVSITDLKTDLDALS